MNTVIKILEAYVLLMLVCGVFHIIIGTRKPNGLLDFLKLTCIVWVWANAGELKR